MRRSRVPSEFRVRRKGDPDPCKDCDGGRCRLCSYGMVWGSTWSDDLSTGTMTQTPCPHGCAQPTAYFMASMAAA